MDTNGGFKVRPIDIELHNQVEEGEPHKVAQLLNKGADPNSRTTNGYTVLMLAVRAWKQSPEIRIEIANILLDNGADPLYISNDGYQAITLTHDIDVVINLLDAGVTINLDIATKIMYRFSGSKQIKNLFEKKGIETDWVDSIRQIYNRILDYRGHSFYADVLEDAIPTIRNILFQLERYKNYDLSLQICYNDECEFYAISRINELLLLSFQSQTAERYVPECTLGQYKEFWEKTGLTVCEPKEFHPFFCEIYNVNECMDDSAPKLIHSRWPFLMFGDLLISRASVSISVGAICMDKKIAEESTLYWCHKRYDRGCSDLSHGWGHNSQWGTSFRLDYWINEELLYNVNHLEKSGDEDDVLTKERQLELLRYRCFIKAPEVTDCFPYEYHALEKYKKRD